MTRGVVEPAPGVAGSGASAGLAAAAAGLARELQRRIHGDDESAERAARTVACALAWSRLAAAMDGRGVGAMPSVTTSRAVAAFLAPSIAGGGADDPTAGLTSVDAAAAVRDFARRCPGEDILYHVHDRFLEAYDPARKRRRGVVSTPAAVARFIVRSVEDVLRGDLGVSDGLADTITWGEMAERNPGLAIPNGVAPETPFVQVLDPATGTGIFLVEVVRRVHATMVARWRAEGLPAAQIERRWQAYVPEHLLPRVHGVELAPAACVLAHLNLARGLDRTGAGLDPSWEIDVRCGNALAQGDASLDHLASPVTVVLGNPPYANMSGNLTASARSLVDRYKRIGAEPVRERNALQLERNLNDDYVKFIALGQRAIEAAGGGVLGLVTNGVYLRSPSLRGLRWHLQRAFDRVRVVDLHGAATRGPSSDRFADDDNVFDIGQPVAIGVFSRTAARRSPSTTTYAELVGTRRRKLDRLDGHTILTLAAVPSSPRAPLHLLTPEPPRGRADEYASFVPLAQVFELFAEGIKTGRDRLVVDFEAEPVLERMRAIGSCGEEDDELCRRIGLRRKKAWNFPRARAALAEGALEDRMRPLRYRPFDTRTIFYDHRWIASPSRPVMRNLETEGNLALLAGRTSRDRVSRLIWCADGLTDKCVLSSLDNVSAFPVMVRDDHGGERPNLHASFLACLPGRAANSATARAEAFRAFFFAYAVLSSPEYRRRYGERMDLDFPRVPQPASARLVDRLAERGADLVALHLLRDDLAAASWNAAGAPGGTMSPLRTLGTTFVAGGEPRIGKGFPRYDGGAVWINRACRFAGVPPDVWEIRVGGYRPARKWLADRAPAGGRTPRPGRLLTGSDVEHYRRLVAALRETPRLGGEIDRIVEEHGGWPAAFAGSRPETRARRVAKAIES